MGVAAGVGDPSVEPVGLGNARGVLTRADAAAEYAVAKEKHPKTIYVREDALTPAIDRWLAQLFDDDHIDETCAALEAASGPDLAEQNRLTSARKKLKECDDKLNKYRQALEAGTDPAIVGEWIEEVKLARKAVYSELNLAVVYHDDGRMHGT